MVDVAVSAQLQQWTFEKPTTLVRPERSGSAASSPDLYHNESETLRIDTAAVDETQARDTKESLTLQERYLSSEEDLSPMEAESDSEYDDDVSIHEVQQQCFSARKMSVSKIEGGKIFDLAVTVSYVSAGRPKVIDLVHVASPVRPTAPRSASFAQLPVAAIEKLRKPDTKKRHSFSAARMLGTSTSRSSSVASNIRSPSVENLPLSRNSSSPNISGSSSFTNTSSRSSSPSVSEISIPSASAAAPIQPAPRSSLYISSTAINGSQGAPIPPPTPLSPGTHSFLSNDPYENATTSAASPIIKSGPHKRLRSISMKLSLAKIAITPSTKKWDSRVNGRPSMPPTPGTPQTPIQTPMTAPPTGSFSSPQKNRLRRNSSFRPLSIRGPSAEDVPPVPALNSNASPKKTMQKMMARGAAERAPIIELPPCPSSSSVSSVDPTNSIKSKQLRKRKSLMDLL